MLTPEENQRLTVLSRAKPVRSTETEKLTRAFEEMEGAWSWVGRGRFETAIGRFNYASFALRLAYSDAGEIAPGWLP